jgi:sodium/hydrogen antiporter
MKRAPITPSLLYLVCGIFLGPHFLNFVKINVTEQISLVEHVTELVVIISVFVGGLKMKPHLFNKRWRPPLLLAFAGLTIAVFLIAGVSWWLLSLPWGVAVLLGAILSPTDPVLASTISVEDKEDEDKLRFSLTAEAGINDGAAFPFLMLGLGFVGVHSIGAYGETWLWFDVLYKLVGAVVIGYVLAKFFAMAINWTKSFSSDHFVADEFFGIGLLLLVYGLCLFVDVYGFLAAFVAGVVFRKNEESQGNEKDSENTTSHIIEFNDNIEKMGEFVIIVFLGSVIHFSFFTMSNILMALGVLFVVRPLSVLPALGSLHTKQRLLVCWFGVRGVGSLFYLSYSLGKVGFTSEMMAISEVVMVTIFASIVLHGITANPLMRNYKWFRRASPT